MARALAIPSPKDVLLILGTGIPPNYHRSVTQCLDKFKQYLQGEYHLRTTTIEKKESGTLPFSNPQCGQGNIILVGNAAGFCNALTGEGIRLAIESGITAGDSI